MRLLNRSALVLSLAALSSAALADPLVPSFTGVGFFGNGDTSFSNAISSDARTVVGTTTHLATDGAARAFRYDSSGMTTLGVLPGGKTTGARGVSGDGSVVVGVAQNQTGGVQAFRWTSSGIVGLGDLPGGDFSSEANAVSADGTTTVGYGLGSNGTGGNRKEAFRHTVAGGMVGIGDLSGGDFRSEAHAVSADGRVIVGESSSGRATAEAFVWTEAGGMVGLGAIAGFGRSSYARGVSADGSVVVGWTTYGSDPTFPAIEAYRWTAATGMVSLFDLPGGAYSSFATAVSPDGRYIVGVGRTETGNAAFLWSEQDGMVELSSLLTTIGLGDEIAGWDLTNATGVTTNEFGFPVITGYGTDPNGNRQGFVAAVPEPATLAALGLGAAALLRRRKQA